MRVAVRNYMTGILCMNTEDKKKIQKTAILCLTEGAAKLALKLGEDMDNCTIYLPARLESVLVVEDSHRAKIRMGSQLKMEPDHAQQGDPFKIVFYSNWQETLTETFVSFNALIYIMATGIVVRSLAPLLQSKYIDPAVVVLDEEGQFAIPLLSGHVGGANRLAREIAIKLGGQAVITTATDVVGKPALDIMAQQMDATIEPISSLKRFNRFLAEGSEINLYSPWPLQASLREGLQWQEWQSGFARGFPIVHKNLPLQPAVIISPFQLDLSEGADILQIRPRNLSVGIGCRKGVTLAEVQLALQETFRVFGLDLRSIKKLASIDFKMSEPGLLDLADELKVPLLGFSREEIASLDGCYEASKQVFERIGVGGVCEPVAMLAANHGVSLMPKQKHRRVTVSVVMEKSWWWDWGLASGT